jgi:very-short-patch-repair endonuclease
VQTVGSALAELAGRQHGVVATRQLGALGLTKDSIAGREARGALHRLHRGVYAVGHTAITVRGQWMAAVLASGDGAVLSHRSATGLWGVWGSGAGEIHVTVPRKSRSQRSIRRHFSVLPDDEKELVDGIPVTSVVRSVLDLASEQGEAAAESALREIEYLGIYGAVSLPTLFDRYPKHRGTPACREALERLRDDPGGRLRSDLEERFISFLDANKIPRPRLNFWLSVGEDRYQVDCFWPGPRLIAELDGWKSHGTKRAFRKDRKRDRRLGAAGFHIVRITEGQVHDEPTELAADLRALLASAPVTATASQGRDRGRRGYVHP